MNADVDFWSSGRRDGPRGWGGWLECCTGRVSRPIGQDEKIEKVVDSQNWESRLRGCEGVVGGQIDNVRIRWSCVRRGRARERLKVQ